MNTITITYTYLNNFHVLRFHMQRRAVWSTIFTSAFSCPELSGPRYCRI